jgi:hypothetical protein
MLILPKELNRTYEIIYLDLDRTLWKCFNENYEEIHAKNLDSKTLVNNGSIIKDDMDNFCHPIHYSSALVNILKEQSKILKIYSLGLEDNIDNYTESSAYKILELLKLRSQFNEIIIEKYRPKVAKANKIKYQLYNLSIEPFNCLLIDDNPYQLWYATQLGINVLNTNTKEFHQMFDTYEH